VVQREILAEIRALRDRLGFSVIFITHDLSLLLEISDRIAIMYAGRLVETGPVAGLFRRPRHAYTQLLIRSIPEPDPDQRWVEDDEDSETAQQEKEGDTVVSGAGTPPGR